MPEPADGPWVAAPIIKGFPQHPGEVRGPHGPVAYVSLAVPIEQRHATVSILAAGLETLKALENLEYQVQSLFSFCLENPNNAVQQARDAIAKARGGRPMSESEDGIMVERVVGLRSQC